MDPERWQRLQDLFGAARAVEGDEREQLLQTEALAEPELVEHARALLAADSQPGIIDELAPRFASVAEVLREPPPREPPPYERLPRRIGAYSLVGEIGRGGAGVVYLAERADGEFKHHVAIKLIGTSNVADPLHQRFIAERQILAALAHPHIARLLDGGIAEDGRPYIVMEYVDGPPITKYCDTHRLDIPARLRLFMDVCAAVQHAHQNLVIHRDLKPSNILISRDARVHLLDFGIAKLINPALAGVDQPPTRFETRMMTPEYASPEQVRGESLTTASDIYSLGVLLYELVCGARPYQLTTGSPAEVVTAVCEQDPERPSVRATRVDPTDSTGGAAQLRGTTTDRLVRLLQGDLDGIVLMAMRKESGRRYASADMLRQDIERYLTGLPVLAHRGGRRYRIAKFLRRHRVQATAGALVLAALVTGLSVAVLQERRASRERDRAERALAEATGVTNFLVELFQAGDAGDAPAQLSAVDLVQRGALRADELSGQPIVHARLLDALGQMSLHLGRVDEAQGRLERAVAIRRATETTPSLDLASSLIHLAWAHRARGDYDRARTLVTQALDIRRAALPPDHADIAEGLYELGYLAAGAEQERLYRQALAILSAATPASERRVRLLQSLSTNLRRQGRFDEAVAASREAVGVAERWLGPEHQATGQALIHLADQVKDIEQDAATAERLYRRGLDVVTRHVGEHSLRLLHGLNSLGDLLGRRGDAAAETLFRRALAISRSATGPEHPRVADQLHKLAGQLARQGRLADAETLARESLDLSIRLVGPRDQKVTASQMPLLARIFDLQRRYREADEMFQAALDQAQRPSNVVIGEMHRDYGLMLLRRGDRPRAEQQLLQSLDLLNQAYGDKPHPNLQETKRALMELYRQMDKPDLVERYRVPPGRFVAY
jgi:serine/threonine protein kinase/tetratricopeptide (TPR) repeat protein